MRRDGKMKARNLRKSLIVLLTSLFMVLTAFTLGLSGAFSVKAEDYAPTESEFYMLDGAQVAQVGNYGMRFTTKISKAYYDKLDNLGDVRFYTTIGPLGFTPAVDEWTDELSFDENGEATIYGVITYGSLSDAQLKEKAAVELTAKAYAEVTPDNGDEAFTIAAVRNDTTRSMRAVANMSLLDDRSTDDKDVLSKYLGNVTREEEVQDITNRNTVVEFDRKVSGRVFLNGVRTNLFVDNQKSFDIGGYLDWNRIPSDGFTVSVFGENGKSVYDVVSKNVKYNLEVFYEDENGNVATDYKILCTNVLYSYVPARHLVEISEMGTGLSQKIINGEASPILTYVNDNRSDGGKWAANATLNDHYIVIGTRTSFFNRVGLKYDKQALMTGGYVVATKGNCIFLFGGDETSSTSASYANEYAVYQLMNEFFGFEVVGISPDPINAETGDNVLYQVGKTDVNGTSVRSWGYSFEGFVYNVNENVKSAIIEGGRYTEYFPDINERGGSYGTSTTDLAKMIRTNGGQSETIMSAYVVSFEDYLKIVDAGAMEKKAWKCNYSGGGHFTYSAEKPTVCTNKNCVDRADVDFTDVTKTVEAYRKVSSNYCMSCGHVTVSFGTPSACLANYNSAINGKTNSCKGTSFDTSTSTVWHTAGHVFPVLNNVEKHADWFGDDAVFACDTCNATSNYKSYYNLTTGEVEPKKCDLTKDCKGTITKYYGSKSDMYACDREDCGITSTAANVGQECACGEGTVMHYPSSTTPGILSKVRVGSSRIPNKMQPCFTAHGNETEYKLMIAEGARKVLNNVKYVDKDNLNREVFAISDIDGTSHCECDECIKNYILYGTMASTQIKFINDLCKFVDAWMDKDVAYISTWLGEADVSSWWTVYDEAQGKYVDITDMSAYQRDIVIHFFAYTTGKSTNTNGDKQAPVVKNAEGNWEAIDSTVAMYQGKYCSTGVYLVTSADSIKQVPKTDANGDYILDGSGNIQYYSYEEIANGAYQYNGIETIFKNSSEYDSSAVREDMQQWSDLSNGTKMYLWVNTQSSNHTNVFYYSANLMDADFFNFMKSTSVDTLFLYASSAEGSAVTAFNNLKLYVNAKRLWDTDGSDTLYVDEDGVERTFDNSQEYLDYLYDTWFNTTFVDEEIVNTMREAFNKEVSMSVRAMYLQAHSTEHPDNVGDEENTSFLGNSQSYTSIMGMNGDYWNVVDLKELYDLFAVADNRLNEIVKEETGETDVAAAWEALNNNGNQLLKNKYLKIKSMLYSEWYSPLVVIMRYYQNDASIIPYRDEMVAKFKEIIDLTGIKYSAEYAPPTSPTSANIYYTTQLEVVILDFTGINKDNSVLATYGLGYELPKDGAIYYKDFNSNGVRDEGETIYDPAVGELNFMEGEKYRVLLRVTSDVGSYKKGDYIVSKSTYFGYTKNVDHSYCGEYNDGWADYYMCSKGAAIIYTTTKREKTNLYDVYTDAAFMRPEDRPSGFRDINDHTIETRYFAGANRTVAVNCDEINILVGMGVTNWMGETVYTIRMNIIQN